MNSGNRADDRELIAELIHLYAEVGSVVNSTHWMADGRLLFAPISYRDRVERTADGDWKTVARELVVQRWWVTDGYFPRPTGPTLARPAA